MLSHLYEDCANNFIGFISYNENITKKKWLLYYCICIVCLDMGVFVFYLCSDVEIMLIILI